MKIIKGEGEMKKEKSEKKKNERNIILVIPIISFGDGHFKIKFIILMWMFPCLFFISFLKL